MSNAYDNKTAVTFLLIGLGVGALLSMFFPPAGKDVALGEPDLSQTAPSPRMGA